MTDLACVMFTVVEAEAGFTMPSPDQEEKTNPVAAVAVMIGVCPWVKFPEPVTLPPVPAVRFRA